MTAIALCWPGAANAQRRRQPATATAADTATDTTATTPAAPATPPAPNARQLFAEGQEAYQRGDYSAAIGLWEQAIAIDPRPQLYYNLAQAFGRLGRIEEEMSALRHYLDGAPPQDPTVASTRARLTSLEQRLAQTAIVLVGSYERGRIVVDGQERGSMPATEALTVRPGSHAVDIFLEGYEPFHAAVVVPAGEQVSITVVLTRSRESELASEQHPMRLPIALYAAGGVLFATGATFGVLAITGGRDSVATTPEADRARTYAIISDATLIPGLAVGAVGLVFQLVRHHDDEPSDRSVTLVPLVGTDRVGLAGRF